LFGEDHCLSMMNFMFSNCHFTMEDWILRVYWHIFNSPQSYYPIARKNQELTEVKELLAEGNQQTERKGVNLGMREGITGKLAIKSIHQL
jgi:hypothetical protein